MSFLDYFKNKPHDLALNSADVAGHRKSKGKKYYNKLAHIATFIKSNAMSVYPAKIIVIVGESTLVAEGTKNEIKSF